MPCGGIYPFEGNERWTEHFPCWECGKPNPTHFIQEWDAFIHKDCIDRFLKTPEGKIVTKHRHSVIR